MIRFISERLRKSASGPGNSKYNNATDPQPYTYSDFTGFGLRNFTRPAGTYTYVIQGCNGQNPDTQCQPPSTSCQVPGTQRRPGGGMRQKPLTHR